MEKKNYERDFEYLVNNLGEFLVEEVNPVEIKASVIIKAEFFITDLEPEFIFGDSYFFEIPYREYKMADTRRKFYNINQNLINFPVGFKASALAKFIEDSKIVIDKDVNSQGAFALPRSYINSRKVVKDLLELNTEDLNLIYKSLYDLRDS